MELPESLAQIGHSSITFPPPIKCTYRNNVEDCMIHQARLAHRLRRDLTRRFLNKGQSSSAVSSEGKSSTADSPTPLFGRDPVELQMQQNQRVIMRSTNVVLLHPGEREERCLGTLEAQLNGFTYTASKFHMVIKNANVDRCFWQGPFLHFHLEHPIMVEERTTKDIQFCFCDETGGRSEEELKNFVHKVKRTMLTYRGEAPITPVYFEALDECKFHGVFPTGRPAIFAVTYSALVEMGAEELFSAVSLHDIEIVNLALLEPEMFHMTVVFRDFKCAVLEIHSIGLEFLPSIKERLNFANVKYYVNMEKRDWSDTVRRISESPETFIREGGWESLHLEDDRTLAYYPDEDSDSEKYSTSLL